MRKSIRINSKEANAKELKSRIFHSCEKTDPARDKYKIDGFY